MQILKLFTCRYWQESAKMPATESLTTEELMTHLSPADAKKCFKNWVKGCKTAICGLCDIEVKLSGNTTNGKKHLVKYHVEAVTALIKASNTKKRSLDTNASSVVNEDGPPRKRLRKAQDEVLIFPIYILLLA
jgi:hypothetical protein